MMKTAALAMLVLCLSGWAQPGRLIPFKAPEFGREDLTRKNSGIMGYSLPGFSMSQSYSMNFTSGNFGSMSSGVYLNTLTYKFSSPVTISMDLGVYNMFSAQGAGVRAMNPGPDKPQFILPRISLEYQPTDKLHFSFHILNGQDAYRAYGSGFDSPFYNPYSPFSRFSRF